MLSQSNELKYNRTEDNHMANILDYIKLRGNKSFLEEPLNEIDELIFSHLSYIDFETSSEGLSLFDAYKQSKSNKIDKNIRPYLWARMGSHKTYEYAQNSHRFKDIILVHQINIISEQQRTQFSATCFKVSNQQYCIAFRGTDETVIGWQEDLMLCYQEEIPAQRYAKEYLEKTLRLFEGSFYLSGHSKGGNLAIYAGCNQQTTLQSRIVSIRNYDGPGFLDKVVNKPVFIAYQDKIENYITENSIFGNILTPIGKQTIIKSSAFKYLEHQILSFMVTGTTLYSVEKLSNQAIIIKESIKSFLDRQSLEERQKVIELLFLNIDQALTNYNVFQLTNDDLVSVTKMIVRMPKKTRDEILSPIKVLIDEISRRQRLDRIQRLRNIIHLYQKRINNYLIKK